MTGNVTKCKTFFPSLQRAGKLQVKIAQFQGSELVNAPSDCVN